VIVLDKVEVGTVQGLMEYLYKGECIVKDRRGLEEMQKLVDMLGIEIKLERKRKRSNLSVKTGSDGNEPNLEETVSGNAVELNTAELVDDQDEIAEDVLKYMELFCASNEDQKCSRCDEWLCKENFMEHLTMHKETSKRSRQNGVDQRTSFSSPGDDQIHEATKLLDDKKTNGIAANVSDLSSPLTEAVRKCLDQFDKGIDEIECEECGEVIVKENMKEHFRNHSNLVDSSIGKSGKKRGPKIGGLKQVGRVKSDDTNSLEQKNIKAIDDSKSNGTSKRKISEVSGEESYKDEYTCFNPTFKIKPGVKKAEKTSKSGPIAPVPEIKLTFNLDDLGLSEETIKLQDLSATNKAVKTPLKKGAENRVKITNQKEKKLIKVVGEEKMVNDASFKEISTNNSSQIFSIPSPGSCPTFPSFLRQVCGEAYTLLPPGMEREHKELGRRVVHRLLGQRIQEGEGGQVARDDVLKEMIDGIEDDENLNDVSSDGSEAPLVMDLAVEQNL